MRGSPALEVDGVRSASEGDEAAPRSHGLGVGVRFRLLAGSGGGSAVVALDRRRRGDAEARHVRESGCPCPSLS